MQGSVMGVITRTNDHDIILGGGFFEAFSKFTLAVAGIKDLTIITPASTKTIHYRPANVVTTADNVLLQFYEGATATGGSALTVADHNRKLTASSSAVFADGPTVSATGAQIGQAFLGGSTGVGQTRNGAQLGESNEWILKPSTTYLLRITNGSSASNTMQVNFVWYET